MAAACNLAGHRAKGTDVLTPFALRAGEGHRSVSLSHTLQGQDSGLPESATSVVK